MKIKKSDISINIQAHKKREDFIPSIKEKVKAKVIWDRNNDVWDTRLMCMEDHIKSGKKWALTIQDDSVLTDNFLEKVVDFINKHNGEKVFFSFYYPHILNKYLEESKEQGFLEYDKLYSGLAICVPTKVLPEIIKRWENTDELYRNDDSRFSIYLKDEGYKVFYPIPSLVQHRDGESLIYTPKERPMARKAKYFDMTIPKHIHQIWIGEKPRPEVMEGWKMKGWDYTLWTEKEIDKLKLKNRELYDFYYKEGIYCGSADVARIEILEKHGGIYIDADTEKLEDLDDASFLSNEFFIARANTGSGQPRLANGIIGSIPKHQILKEYRETIATYLIPRQVLPVWSTIGSGTITKIMEKYKDKPGVEIIDPHYFFPFDMHGNPSETKGKSYGRHYWFSTYENKK